MKKNFLCYFLIGMLAVGGAACSNDDPEPLPDKPGQEDPPKEDPPGEDPPQEDPVIHLGDPANTYIVSEAGEYKFDTRKVSGDEISGIVKADWIWATKLEEADTEQKLISDVKYEDGKISFTATGERGNVVIAGFNESNKSVWVWLIWCTEQPETMAYSSGSEFMDRAMGATSATPGDRGAVGTILYQYGRNVPIFGGYEEEWDENGETFNEARKWTIMNPEYGYEWTVTKTSIELNESFAYPTTFFVNPENSSWQHKKDFTLWGTKKTDYDPSPAGYQLPTPEDWGDIMEKMVYDPKLKGAIYSLNGKEAWIPEGNRGRAYDTGEFICGMTPFATYWNGTYYFEDTPWLPEPYMFPSRANFNFNPEVVGGGVDCMANASFAFTTRCVKTKTAE